MTGSYEKKTRSYASQFFFIFGSRWNVNLVQLHATIVCRWLLLMNNDR